MKKTVVFDVSGLLKSKYFSINGIVRTTISLLKEFEKMNLPFELKLFSQKLTSKKLVYDFDKKFKRCHLYLPKWDIFKQITNKLPIIETICKGDLYHIPHNFGAYYDFSKVILTIHDTMFFSVEGENFGDYEFLRNNLRKYAPKVKKIITCSYSSKKDIIKYLNIQEEKVKVIYWGIDHNTFYYTQDKIEVSLKLKKLGIKKPYFLSTSCDIGRKNTPLLVEQYLKLAKNNPINDLVLVWKNPPDDIVNLINKSIYKDRIHILNYVSDEELRTLYQGCSAFVFPSKYEGFGLPVLEAMACGAPVITTPYSSLPEVGGDAAYYIDLQEKDVIFNTLKLFDANKIDINEMIEKGLKHANKFTWEKCAKDTIEVYKEGLNI